MSTTDKPKSKAEELLRTMKGVPYPHPQPEGLVAVREYRIADGGGTPCLLLKWALEADLPVDRFLFAVEELDAVGDLLETLTVTCEGTDIPPVHPGECFVPPRGILLREACTDIRVRLLEVESAGYLYRVRDGRVTVDYRGEEPWTYEDEGGASEGLSSRVSLRVRSKLSRRARFLWPVALLTFLLILLAILAPGASRDDGLVPWADQVARETQIIRPNS